MVGDNCNMNISCMCITETVKLCHRDCEIVVMFVNCWATLGFIAFGNGHFIAVMLPKFLKSFVTLRLLIEVIPSHSNVMV